MIVAMDEIKEQARMMRHLSNFALTVLQDKAGGSVTITEAEYRQVLERHGGASQITIRPEYLTLGNGRKAMRAMLVRKEPQQADLPV